nr:carbon-nitrogen hydrolase family protein [Enterovibrio nigricans]
MALCQFHPSKGDMLANFAKHKTLIEQAAEQGANLVVFPELSLTGYEPQLLKLNAIVERGEIENAFAELAKECGVTIIAGVPLQSGANRLCCLIRLEDMAA